jgi:6-phosphogluconolactonase (cycloisomerase 2 family)
MSGSPFTAGGADTSPNSVTVDPTGQFLFVASESTQTAAGNIAAFTINPSTGALTAVGSPFATGVNTPGSVAVDPSGRFVYAANEDEINSSACTPNPSCYLMSSFAIGATTGALTYLSYSSPTSAGNFAAAADPLGQFVYVTQAAVNDVAGLSTDSTTGALTVLTDSPFADGESSPLSIAVDPSGKFAYAANTGANNITAYTIDATSGDLTVISGELAVAAGTSPISVVTTGTVH